MTFDTISDGTISIAAFVDEDDMSSDSATLVPTQQSVKAYVDAVTTELNAQDLDFQADSGGALSIDLDTETMTFTGGTGIDTSGSLNTVTFAIDSTVTTLTGTQTLTNKTLTSPDVDTPDIDGGTIDGATIATSDITVGTGKTLDVSGGTLTLADDQISGDKVEGGTIASTTITSLASTTVDTTNVEVTNIKAKDGTSAGSIADTTGVVTLASSVLTTTDINGGTIDGATIGATTAAAGSFTTVSATGNITVGGTVDGRDVATDGTKLDTVETNADVTDTTNVTAAGAVMDSELTNETAVKSLNQGVATTDSPTFAGLTTTADVSFGDNDKAIFGAGSDLQIYHDGFDSYVKDAGTGDLYLQGSNNVQIESAAGANMIFATAGAQVRLFYNGSPKFNTTSTGIDVTGTAVTDGLTVDTAIATSTASFRATTNSTTIGQKIGSLDFFNGTTNAAGTLEVRRASGGNAYSDMALMASANGNRSNQLLLSTNGDISFYEDTGTTAKLFWDASAESLFIGATSASALNTYSDDLIISNTVAGTGAGISIVSSATNGYSNIHFGDTDDADIGRIQYNNATNEMTFRTNTSDAITIDSSQNVGIGTTSPAYPLEVKVGSDKVLRAGTSFVSIDSTGSASAPSLIIDGDDNTGFWHPAADTLAVSTGGSERMRITSNGRVGIGVTSPAADGLHIGTVNGNCEFDLDNTSGRRYRIASKSDSSLVFEDKDSSAERMRIDSSGNLLVGKSSSDVGATAGFEWYDTANVLTLTRSGGHGLSVNRLSSDGDVVTFRKDGTTVGSIQSRSGAVTTMVFDPRSNGSGITGTTNGLLPTNQAGTPTNDHVDLGSDSNKFKDLYLSGGVQYGTTGAAAELLDDYEEGTWTPVLKDSGNGTKTLTTAEGKYIKVGSKVTIWFNVVSSNNLSDVNYNQLQSLPFTPSSDQANYRTLGFAHVAQTTNNRGVPHTVRWFTGTTVFLHCFHDGTTVNAAYADEISGCFEYFV